MELEGSLQFLQERALWPCVTFSNKLFFNGEQLLALRPTSKLEDHPLSAVSKRHINCTYVF
jgi:hypothetical protein